MTKQLQLPFSWCKLTIMDAVGNDIFTAIFIKNDGRDRKMTCRFGQDKGGLAIGEHDRILTVLDMSLAKGASNAYRRINLDTLKSIKHAGNLYNF